MFTIAARNVNEALCIAVPMLQAQGIHYPSRNGEMIELPRPLTTQFHRSSERVLLHEERDANPFFHLFESLWMLAGRNDVEFPARFVRRMLDYSDDGKTLNGAYGHRWRKRFDRDQIEEVARLLRTEPFSRRAYIGMWDPRHDGRWAGKDFPCNVGAVFSIRGGALALTVFNRSNDVIWGAYGANAVHMSILHEYMQGKIGTEFLGSYYQVSNSFHVYPDVAAWGKVKRLTPGHACPYELGEVKPYPMLATGEDPAAWDADLIKFFAAEHHELRPNYATAWWGDVAEPMYAAWLAAKHNDFPRAISIASEIAATDWRRAAADWIKRRAH